MPNKNPKHKKEENLDDINNNLSKRLSVCTNDISLLDTRTAIIASNQKFIFGVLADLDYIEIDVETNKVTKSRRLLKALEKQE